MGLVKNACVYSGLRIQKLAVFQEVFHGINWFYVCWYKFRKAKSFFNSFWVVVVKNGWKKLNWWNELIFCVLVQIRKAKSYCNNYWVSMVKNGWGLIDHRTLKASVFWSHISLDGMTDLDHIDFLMKKKRGRKKKREKNQPNIS